jgi:hypothetical protein
MATKRQRTEIEWVGGLVSMPVYVTGEGEPFRPEVMLWMGADGALLGSATGKPGEVLGTASAHLSDAIERPAMGRPHAPTRVRVASPELAAALQAGHPGLAVVCAPTPELDAVFAAMFDSMDENTDEEEQSYLSADLEPEAVASFFRAAAALFRTKPWEAVPGDEALFSVTIEVLGVRDAVVSIIGELGQSFGLIVFSSSADLEAYIDAADAEEHGEKIVMPAHLALQFVRGAELGRGLRKEIAQHRFEIATANAYPWLFAVDEDLIARPPIAREMTIAEVIALALPEMLRAKKALSAAWRGGESVVRALSVRTHAGDVGITLRAPLSDEVPATEAQPDGVLAALRRLAWDGDDLAPDAREPLEEALLRRFLASPEAESLHAIEMCREIMDLAADYHGATIATLRARELRDILFELIPRKVAVDAPAARGIIEESHALYAFLKREYGLRQADACLAVLGGDAVAKLEAALSDSSNFGMAKSLFMGGAEVSIELPSGDDIEAWKPARRSQPHADSRQLPLFGAPLDAAPQGGARAKAKTPAKKPKTKRGKAGKKKR